MRAMKKGPTADFRSAVMFAMIRRLNFLFSGIYRACNSGERGMLYWTGNWVTFLDSLLQTALLAERADSLRLPTRVRYLRIDPVKHMEHIQEKGDFLFVQAKNFL